MDISAFKKQLSDYEQFLRCSEKSGGTIEKYLRDARGFITWWENSEAVKQPLGREVTVRWRQHLQEQGYASVTINSMLGALNSVLHYVNRPDCCVRYLRIQHRMFRNESRQLSRREYDVLLGEAKKSGKTQLAMVMETICATGIRVSELQYITIEAVLAEKTEIVLKGKVRTILIPRRLAAKLKKYARKENIRFGPLFLNRKGQSLSRKRIWAEMKALCVGTGIAPTKVFPHNLRHLFATVFYGLYQDIVRLADVLGHSSMETTRIYLLTPEREHARQLEDMDLVT